MPAVASYPLARWFDRVFDIDTGERPAVAAGFAVFFLLFTAYFMLRPVREAMGVAGGVDNLPWLFTGTFIATLAAQPLFGWLASRVARRRILAWTYAFFAVNLLGFGLGLALRPENLWIGRAFYVWLSVFNLLALSVAWSVLADLFAAHQARRLFALMAAGLSLGGLVGPQLGVALVGHVGLGGLLLLSALLLCVAIAVSASLQRWRDRHPLPDASQAAPPRNRALGGSPFAGAVDVFRSPYLLGIASFVLLLTSVTTFLYFEQARLVETYFPDRESQYRVFANIDTVVQCLAIGSQLFITGRIAKRLGVVVLLVAVPLVVAAGFVTFALMPTFAVFVIVMVVRRAGDYAFVRPGREMLFSVISPAAKYKAKNFIDTVIYRTGDVVSGWAKTGVDALASQPAIAMAIGALIALTWAANGAALARSYRRRIREQETDSAREDAAAAHTAAQSR